MDTAFLQRSALFGGFVDDEIAALRAYFTEGVFSAGEVLVRQGEIGDRLFFLIKGRVAVTFAYSGQNVSLIQLGPGATFGEMELIDVQARSATVTALGNGRFLSLRNRDLLHLYGRNLDLFARLVLNVAREISRRLRATNQRLAEIPLREKPAP